MEKNKKQFLLIANWKMNKDVVQAEKTMTELVEGWEGNTTICVCPPVIFLEQCFLQASESETANILTGVQNISWEESGAFTGEVSAEMVARWADMVLIGHSERRQYFAETNIMINKKIKLCLKYNMIPVLCLGEKRLLSDNMVELTKDLRDGLNGLTPDEVRKIVVAYEPVWAIGTGEAANPEYVNNVIRQLRLWMKDEYGFEVADSVRFLYGGSVDEKNAKNYLSQEQVDGLLIGGVSLHAKKLIKIAKQAEKISGIA